MALALIGLSHHTGAPVAVRNPHAIRPWQHVLNPLSGYLVLAQAIWASAEHASSWNFGPPEDEARPVGWLVERLAELWPGQLEWTVDDGPHPHEAHYLKLDSSLARARLGWRPLVPLEIALTETAAWYRELQAGADIRQVTLNQLELFGGPAAGA